MMLHLLQVFMSLRLILFLLTTYRYMIPVVAHTYGLICRASRTVESSQRESLTFKWAMVQDLQLLLYGLMF